MKLYNWNFALRLFLAACAVWMLMGSTSKSAQAAEWQWSVQTTSANAAQTKDYPRAFLWVPPKCRRIRAVVVANNNMIEQGILEHPAFRKTLADLGIAEVWVTPGFDPWFDFNKGAGERFTDMMTALAQESGYIELQYAPTIPLGHSACASYPWNFAAWGPARTLAILSVHGDAPQTTLTGSGKPNPDWGDRNTDGVPGLMVMGEYEWGEARLAPAEDYRFKHPAAPIAFLADAGHGHFDYSDQLVTYLALFIRKAALYRLPADAPLDQPVALKPVDPKQGWLVDRWRHDYPALAPPAPFDKYRGDRREAFWCFDREIAQATEDYYKPSRGKKPQLLGFVQNGKVVPQKPGTLEQVHLDFLPQADGISFHLTGTFIGTVPPGNPVMWTGGLPPGSPVGHATGSGPIILSRIVGPVEQTGPDTFRIHFDRTGMDDPRKSNVLWLLARHPGDSVYKSAVQQANLIFPVHNTEGAAQHITFPAIPDQMPGAAPIKLDATSDAGVPVYYYVREGPAEVEGDTLRFTAVPPRAKYPVKITVIAWQYGRGVTPLLQSADPIMQTFLLQAPSEK